MACFPMRLPPYPYFAVSVARLPTHVAEKEMERTIDQSWLGQDAVRGCYSKITHELAPGSTHRYITYFFSDAQTAMLFKLRFG